MIIKLFEDDYVICELDDSLPVLRHRWKKEPDGSQFKSILVRILDEYNTLKHSYAKLAWLADTTLLGELDEEAEQWLADEWDKLLFQKAGVRIHAVILGTNIFADYPMEQFKTEAGQKYKS